MTIFLKKTRIALSLSLACLGVVASTHSTLAYSAETSFYSTRNHLPKLQFDLTVGDNQRLSAKDLEGKVVLVYFGYTYCPDVCPTTMAELALMKSSLTAQQQEQVQVLMISVDPHRDTPKRLEQYLDAFGMGALGVTGLSAVGGGVGTVALVGHRMLLRCPRVRRSCLVRSCRRLVPAVRPADTQPPVSTMARRSPSAGATGLEPATCGFGDRCSAS